MGEIADYLEVEGEPAGLNYQPVIDAVCVVSDDRDQLRRELAAERLSLQERDKQLQEAREIAEAALCGGRYSLRGALEAIAKVGRSKGL